MQGGLGKYLASMGIPAFILPEKFTSGRSCFLPYIFTDSELKALFHVIDVQGGKENSLQPFLLSTVFRLIYTCGLRPNEGRMLKRESVNLATGEILITETKGHKERIVVMSDDMTELAASYARLRDAAYPDSPYFFPDRNGNSYSSPWMQNKFKAFFAAANPGVDPDMLPPVRIYDLRHRFASSALGRWLDNGENLFNRLPYLRAYMGHKELSATVYYIHLLPENLVKVGRYRLGFLKTDDTGSGTMGRIKDEAFFQMVHDYLKIYLPNQMCASSNTVRAYRTALDQLIGYAASASGISISEVTFGLLDSGMVSGYLDWLVAEKGCSASTRNHRFACIRSFFRYAAAANPENIVLLAGLDRIPRQKQEKFSGVDYMSETAVKALLEQPDTKTRRG